ncbi:hypothetical protein GCM10017687_90020 [Streptomyces echinatus]
MWGSAGASAGAWVSAGAWGLVAQFPAPLGGAWAPSLADGASWVFAPFPAPRAAWGSAWRVGVRGVGSGVLVRMREALPPSCLRRSSIASAAAAGVVTAIASAATPKAAARAPS